MPVVCFQETFMSQHKLRCCQIVWVAKPDESVLPLPESSKGKLTIYQVIHFEKSIHAIRADVERLFRNGKRDLSVDIRLSKKGIQSSR